MQGKSLLLLCGAAIAVVFFGIVAVFVPSAWVGQGVPPSPLRESRSSTLLFVGDLLYDRTIRTYADMHGDEHIFSCMKDELQKYDMVVANLEGPITDNTSVSVDSAIDSPENKRFTMPLRTAEVLFANNIRAVSLGNNHIYDFGAEGIDTTREALERAGVQYFGDPRDSENTAVRLSGVEAPVVLVAFNEFAPGGASLKATLSAIEKQSKSDTVIVFAHWGNEYASTTERQKMWARAFIDSGADMVIGAHPHVVQSHEEYKGAPIYYSLGNFIFDQYGRPGVKEGLGLAVTISKQGIEKVVGVPNYRSTDRRTCFSSERL